MFGYQSSSHQRLCISSSGGTHSEEGHYTLWTDNEDMNPEIYESDTKISYNDGVYHDFACC